MTRRKKSGWALALTAVFFNPLVAGLIFGILPCYALPSIGSIRWCGYKSEPPHFTLQFSAGALVSIAVLVVLTRRWLRLHRSEDE